MNIDGNARTNSGLVAAVESAATQTSSSFIPTSGSDLLPASHCYGDPMFELQALVVQLNFKDKGHARELREHAEQTLRAAVKRTVAEMKDAAEQRFWGQVISSSAQIAAGGLQMGGYEGAAKSTEGTGNLFAAGFNYHADLADARSVVAQADMRAAERAIDSAQEARGEAHDAMRAALERLSEILMREEECKRAALFKA